MRLITAFKHVLSGLRRHWFPIAGVAILCGLSFFAGWYLRDAARDPGQKLLDAAYSQITQQSVFNQRAGNELANAGIRGMLGVIDDPYAELIEPEAAHNFMNTFTGRTGVVGLYANNEDGKVIITIVYPGGAAQAAGIRVGDELLAIDGQELDADTDSSEAGLLMRGVPGTTLHLKTSRDGQVQEYDLVRKEQQFVASRMLPGNVGYIALMAYNQTASRQMKTALQDLLAQKPAGLVWDLRNNEGGDMQAAQQILSYFIDDGLLFTAQLAQGQSIPFRALGGALAPDLPLVVLVDHTTYSAAETSAAAIAETGRGQTVGSTTYGKGVIQGTIPLVEDTMLQMTVARWYSPTGAWYHHRGVTPQIAAVDDPASPNDELLEAGLQVLQDAAP